MKKSKFDEKDILNSALHTANEISKLKSKSKICVQLNIFLTD